MLDAGDRSGAMEATSHGSALGRLDGIRFASLAFTNLTQDHLDLHGTMDAYFEAKRRLFLEGRPPAAINVGDPWGRKLAEDRPDALTYGFAEDAEIRPEALDGIDLKLKGRFNVENALAAMASARLLGIDDDAIARGLEALDGVPGRFEAVDEGQPFTVVVDYAHTPDSLENVLTTARDLDAGTRDLRLRLRRRPRPREAADDGPDREPTSPTSRSSPPTTRAARTRARSSTRSSPASDGELEIDPGPALGDRARDRDRGAGRRRCHRRQGPRAGSAVPRPNSSLR